MTAGNSSVKSILIVSEHFTLGGLETRLRSKIQFLYEHGFNVILAVGNNYVMRSIPFEFCKKVYTDINFQELNTSQDIVKVVERLAAIIEENDINIIEAHPFNSILPAFFSAVKAEIPFTVEIHGPTSFLEGQGMVREWFNKNIVLRNASLIQCVSQEIQELLQQYIKDVKSCIVQNGADKVFFSNDYCFINDFTKCCLVSRLDYVKVEGIKKFIQIAAYTNIKYVDIYGDGPAMQELKEWIAANPKYNSICINLKSANYNIRKVYKRYSLVAGMGRVALEGLALNKPVILVGYNGVKGLINKKNIKRASYSNFSGRNLRNISVRKFVEQTEQLSIDHSPFCISNWIRDHAYAETFWDYHVEVIKSLNNYYPASAKYSYQAFEEHKSEIPFPFDEGLVEKLSEVHCY